MSEERHVQLWAISNTSNVFLDRPKTNIAGILTGNNGITAQFLRDLFKILLHWSNGCRKEQVTSAMRFAYLQYLFMTWLDDTLPLLFHLRLLLSEDEPHKSMRLNCWVTSISLLTTWWQMPLKPSIYDSSQFQRDEFLCRPELEASHSYSNLVKKWIILEHFGKYTKIFIISTFT